MAENSSGNTASVAIVVLVLAALVFVYLVFVRNRGDDAEIKIDLDGSAVVLPHEAPSPPVTLSAI